ncbi:MAG TPA: DUF1704 domain-containing protein [Woeseiaceae bacterium]|nr:DUF1704 domain-containing protein [Woeseiaceae bacterium]
MQRWERGNPALPEVSYDPADYSPQIRQLDSIIRRASALEHPLADYLKDTAQSYIDVARLIGSLGTSRMTELSIGIYGRPGNPITGGDGATSLDAAKYFIDVGAEFYATYLLRDADYCLSAQTIKDDLEAGLKEVFDDGLISVVVDPDLAAKAAAGATRIRLRDSTCFSPYDAQQLLQHEVFVHSLTALNGRSQATISAMSLGAPRTTAAQEGLATFAELVTGSIDISRLERIAMRIIAIDMALNGADFIDVFRYFVDTGLPVAECYNSAMRVFRGAPVSGGHAFTKDSVYLRGMLEVHTFFRWAFKEQKFRFCQHFFAGRMTLNDVVRYESFFEDGTLSQPKYLPPWMTRTAGLGGYLAFSVFANTINLAGVQTEHDFYDLIRH